MRTIVRFIVVGALLLLAVALGRMVFPLAILAVLVLLAYGVGKASRWGWR